MVGDKHTNKGTKPHMEAGTLPKIEERGKHAGAELGQAQDKLKDIVDVGVKHY